MAEKTTPTMTREQQHEWALAIAEWAERLAGESTQLAAQARGICERVMPEKYEDQRKVKP